MHADSFYWESADTWYFLIGLPALFFEIRGEVFSFLVRQHT